MPVAINSDEFMPLWNQLSSSLTILDDEDLAQAIERLNTLLLKGKLTAAEARLKQILTAEIEAYENSAFPEPEYRGVDMLRHLMELHGLHYKDLAPELGPHSVVSAILTGKRHLNLDHIRRLSARFQVSPELFID